MIVGSQFFPYFACKDVGVRKVSQVSEQREAKQPPPLALTLNSAWPWVRWVSLWTRGQEHPAPSDDSPGLRMKGGLSVRQTLAYPGLFFTSLGAASTAGRYR